MNIKAILTSSIAILLGSSAYAENPIIAQPITVTAEAGTEQSDFFIATDRHGNDKVVFSALMKTVTAHGHTTESRALFSQTIYKLLPNETFFLVNGQAPLTKLTTLAIPVNATFPNPAFDNFLFNSDSDSGNGHPALGEEFFHVPGKGLYCSTGGGAPHLVKAESATAPFTGAALQFPGDTAGDTNRAEQFRVVLGSTVAHKGSEPLISKGTALTTVLLDDLQPGAAGSDPQQFVTYGDGSDDRVYFVATPDGSTFSVYRTTTSVSGTKVKFGVQPVITGLNSPQDLTSDGQFSLFYSDATSPGGSERSLYVWDGTNVSAVSPGSNPEQLVPTTDLSGDVLAYSSLDNAGARRFTVYSDGGAYFTDDSTEFTNPTHITAGADSFFYGATIGGGLSYVVRDFPVGQGGGGPDVITYPGGTLTNLQETCFIPDNYLMYFTADLTVGSNVTPGALFFIDASDTSATQATAVRTNAGHFVAGAHNLRAISGNGIARLYFSAPVDATDNAEYFPTTPHLQKPGTKAWVTSQ